VTLNELSLDLEGANINIFKFQEKVEATVKKIRLWTQRVEKGNFKSFCTLTELQEKYAETNISDAISAAIKEHLLDIFLQLTPVKCGLTTRLLLTRKMKKYCN
jgi:hypothetical protein